MGFVVLLKNNSVLAKYVRKLLRSYFSKVKAWLLRKYNIFASALTTMDSLRYQRYRKEGKEAYFA